MHFKIKDKEPTGLSCTTVHKESEINGYLSFILCIKEFFCKLYANK